MKLSETVQEVIRLGTASRAYWDRELPKSHPHYPVLRPGEPEVPPPGEEAQIRSLLKGLPEPQVYTLVLLAHLGRREFTADRLPTAYDNMKEAFPTKDIAIAEMAENANVGEDLTDALEELTQRRIDLDTLSFANGAP